MKQKELILKNLQLISFEIINRCNKTALHPWCPSNRPERYADSDGRAASDEDFLTFLDAAVGQGFRGLVGFHYYCEPTLDLPRCRDLAAAAHARGLRTLLWTNAKVETFPSDAFDEIRATNYSSENITLNGKSFQPDDRIGIYEAEPVDHRPCYRPSRLELPVNYFGDVRLCCGDWKGTIRIGNIKDRENFPRLFLRWECAAKACAAGGLDICRRCRGLARTPALDLEGWII
jgi:hypothetical protein